MKSNKEILVKDVRNTLVKRTSTRYGFRKVPEQVLFETYQRLRSGVAGSAIAAWLQKSGYFKKKSLETVRKMVDDLRVKLSPLLVAPAPRDKGPTTPIKDVGQLTDLEQIESVQAEYASLIQSEIADAKAGGNIPPSLSKHVNALSSLHKTKQMLIEAEAAKPKRPVGELTAEQKARFRVMVSGLDPNEVSNIVDRFLAAGEPHCIQVEMLEDGSFRQVAEDDLDQHCEIG